MCCEPRGPCDAFSRVTLTTLPLWSLWVVLWPGSCFSCNYCWQGQLRLAWWLLAKVAPHSGLCWICFCWLVKHTFDVIGSCRYGIKSNQLPIFLKKALFFGLFVVVLSSVCTWLIFNCFFICLFIFIFYFFYFLEWPSLPGAGLYPKRTGGSPLLLHGWIAP